MSQYNLVLAGLGGQGVMTISQILAAAASHEGLEVRLFEGTGITQRGGGVYSFVRFGKAYSPRMPVGEADAIICLEISEVASVLHYLKSKGRVWTNSVEIHSYYSKLRPESYPGHEQIEAMIRLKTGDFCIIPANQLARESGALRAVNMVMIGAFSQANDFLKTGSMTWAIEQINPKFAAANLKAFWGGYRFVENGVRSDDW